MFVSGAVCGVYVAERIAAVCIGSTAEGDFYGIAPNINTQNVFFGWYGWKANEYYMKQLGLTPPETLDELYDYLKAVKQANPVSKPLLVYPVFPREQIGPGSDPRLAARAARTIRSIRTNGNNDMVTMSMAYIRLRLGEAYDYLRGRICAQQYRNGTLSLSPGGAGAVFNFGGIYTEQFGIVMPITELLLQSVGGVICLFPAWPRRLDAEFTRLRAEGAFLVSASLSGGSTWFPMPHGKVRTVTIESLAGCDATVRSEWDDCAVQDETGAMVPHTTDEAGRLSFPTRPGGVYRIVGK